MHFKSFHWLKRLVIMVYHALQLIITFSYFFRVSLLLFFFSFLHFGGVFNKTIIPLTLAGHEMIIANLVLVAPCWLSIIPVGHLSSSYIKFHY